MLTNVHNSNVTEAQCAILKVMTPLLLAMSPQVRQTDIIGNAHLCDDLAHALQTIRKTEENMARSQKPAEELLKFTGVTVKVPVIKKFMAATAFVIDPSEKGRVRISYLGDNFKEWFGEKVEENLPEAELKLSKLLKKSVDKPIMDELGEKCELSLYGFHETLADKQATNDRSWTIGYALDVNGVRRAVSAGWGVDGWDVDAYAVDAPYPWSAGRVVVSR